MFDNQQPDVQHMQTTQSQNQFVQQAQVDAAFGIPSQPQPQPQQPFIPPPPQFPAQTGPAFVTNYQAQNPYAQVAQQQQQAIPAIIQANTLPLQQQSQPVQPNFTGTGFGGYTPSDQNAVTAPPMPTIPQGFAQPLQQPSYQQSQQPQQLQTQQLQTQQQSLSSAVTGQTDTNPFRQSTVTGSVSSTPSPYATSAPAAALPKSTNPFTRQASPTNISPTSPPTSFPISAQSTSAYPQQMPISAQPTMRSMPTGTNPFTRGVSSTGTGLTLPANVTGASVTNPFRQSMMTQQQNGAPQGTIGGWENLETVQVFPRNNGANGGPNGGQQQQQGETGGW
jgi:hypothetical protein